MRQLVLRGIGRIVGCADIMAVVLAGITDSSCHIRVFVMVLGVWHKNCNLVSGFMDIDVTG